MAKFRGAPPKKVLCQRAARSLAPLRTSTTAICLFKAREVTLPYERVRICQMGLNRSADWPQGNQGDAEAHPALCRFPGKTVGIFVLVPNPGTERME